MTAEPVLDREGEPTGEYRFDSSGAARGLELLGKHLQMFTDKIKVEKINVDLNAYADLTDKELTMKANSRQIGKN